MALTQISRAVSTSGDVWTTLVSGAANVTSLTCAAKSAGISMVAVQLKKGANFYLVVPPEELPEGGAARLRIPPMVLEADDALQVKSIGAVDWTASGVTP